MPRVIHAPAAIWIVDFGDSGYVVRYHVGETGVTILAIRHQKEAGYS
jgi:plasmid stabilization system protein ParE